MAVTVAELVARLTADTSQFKAGMQDAGATVTQTESKFKRFGNTVKTGLGIGAGVVGFTMLTRAAQAVGRELGEAQRVAAQTRAVLKSTGGVAGVTAKQVDSLASALSRKTGIDDEAIASGENLLLTFKSIRNEAGKGNDIFNRATKIALDLSVAWGQDMKSSAIQLGKALEDPIAGLTSLRRVGIQFTDAQEKTIKALVETGDVVGAQKIILKELETQVGGSAKAYGETLPGQLAKTRNALLETGATILEKATPAIMSLAGAAQKVVEWLGPDGIMAVAIGLGVAKIASVLSANPYVALIAATAALVVLIAQNWDRIKRIVIDAINVIIGALNALPWVDIEKRAIPVSLGPAAQEFLANNPSWSPPAPELYGPPRPAPQPPPAAPPPPTFDWTGGLPWEPIGFAKGGVVPGPIGAPVPAIVHGGEEVLRPDQRGNGDTFNIYTLYPEETAAAVVTRKRTVAFLMGR